MPELMKGRRGPNGSDIRSDIQSCNGLPQTTTLNTKDVPVKPAIEDHRYSYSNLHEDPGIRLAPSGVYQPKYVFPEIVKEDIPIRESPSYTRPNAPKFTQKELVVLA